MNEAVTRDDVVKTAWRLSGWQVDQRSLDEFLAVVDRYASGVSAQSQAPLPEGLRPLPDAPAPGQRFEAENGALWIYMGVPKRRARPRKKRAPWVAAATEPEDDRECRICARTKAINQFRKDTHSRNGRRTECLECENKKRREREVAKRREKRQ